MSEQDQEMSRLRRRIVTHGDEVAERAVRYRESLYRMRRSGEVERCHTVRTLMRQNVAQHSYNLACIVLVLTEGKASAVLLAACLHHDAPEVMTGDTPANAKFLSDGLENSLRTLEGYFFQQDRLYDAVAGLTAEERKLMKFADLLELLMFLGEEVMFGNQHAFPMYRVVRNALVDRGFPSHLCAELFNAVDLEEMMSDNDRLFRNTYYPEL